MQQAAQKEKWKRDITLFLSSQTISLFGSALVQYAIMWYVTLTTKSGLMMTLFIICGFIPTFLLSPFAGVWADRYNRKRLIMIADGMIASVTLVLAVTFLLGYKEPWLLFVIAAVRALGAGIQTPAVAAILPQIVPEDKLTRVNGINGSLQALMMFVAPIVSAGLLSWASIEFIFFIDVVTAAMAISTLFFFLKLPLHEKALDQQSTSYFDDFRQGLSYTKNHSFLKPFFIFFAFFFVLMAPAAFLTPLQVARTFGDSYWGLTAIEIAFSIGMMAGGALIASWGGFRNRVYTMALANVVMGVCTLLLGVVPIFWVYLIFMGIFGVAMPMANTPTMVMLQERLDPNYMGRVFGVFGMISTSMMPLGMMIFGPLADVVPIEWLLVGTGVLIIALALLFASNKALVEAGKPLVKKAT
ncbi:putative bacilysin exporter BacE [compost metagenome]